VCLSVQKRQSDRSTPRKKKGHQFNHEIGRNETIMRTTWNNPSVSREMLVGSGEAMWGGDRDQKIL